MPYIKPEQRKEFQGILDELTNLLNNQKLEDVDGCLNYVITYLCKSLYLPKYYNYNRCIGVLESAKLEMYRAVVGVYEEMKREDNQDVIGKIQHKR